MSKKSKHNRRDRKSGNGPIGWEHGVLHAARKRGLYLLFGGHGEKRRWDIWDTKTGKQLGLVFPGEISPNDPPATVHLLAKCRGLSDCRAPWPEVLDLAAAAARGSASTAAA